MIWRNLCIWLNDSDVRAGLDKFLPLSMVEEERWYERMLETPAEEHPLVIEVQRSGYVEIHWRLRFSRH